MEVDPGMSKPEPPIEAVIFDAYGTLVAFPLMTGSAET